MELCKQKRLQADTMTTTNGQIRNAIERMNSAIFRSGETSMQGFRWGKQAGNADQTTQAYFTLTAAHWWEETPSVQSN